MSLAAAVDVDQEAPPLSTVTNFDSLALTLHDWTDFDVASLAVGKLLGVFAATSTLVEHKHVFWSNCPLGSSLTDRLRELVERGVLETDQDDGTFRFVHNLHAGQKQYEQEIHKK